jgi:hypothetical protein
MVPAHLLPAEMENTMNEQTSTTATATVIVAPTAQAGIQDVLLLGDAAELTLGGDAGSSEDKRFVYA